MAAALLLERMLLERSAQEQRAVLRWYQALRQEAVQLPIRGLVEAMPQQVPEVHFLAAAAAVEGELPRLAALAALLHFPQAVEVAAVASQQEMLFLMRAQAATPDGPRHPQAAAVLLAPVQQAGTALRAIAPSAAKVAEAALVMRPARATRAATAASPVAAVEEAVVALQLAERAVTARLAAL